MRALMLRWPISFLFSLSVAITSGCSTHGGTDTRSEPVEWGANLSLASQVGYSKLFVEIDAIEGSLPSTQVLESLREFLIDRCQKPDGVIFSIDDVISREQSEGVSSKTLALLHLDGPPDGESAFLYLLFYDSTITGEGTKKPFFTYAPFPGAIFFDQEFFNTILMRSGATRERALLHEAGHALGLSRNLGHGDGWHCTNDACLMNENLRVSFSKWLFGADHVAQKQFCDDCEADIVLHRNAKPPENMKYRGPYFIRSEELYHVVSQPGLIYVQFGSIGDLDEGELAALRQRVIENQKEPGRAKKKVLFDSSSIDMSEAQSLVHAMREDSDRTVRDMAKKLEAMIEESRKSEAPSSVAPSSAVH